MFVTPGQKFSVKGTLVHEGSGYAITKASIELGGKPICDAELTFRVTDFPSAEMRQKMRETAALVGFPAEVPANG
jgi:3-hydroxyacyl-[acyl-carrier-protein] dehydratase